MATYDTAKIRQAAEQIRSVAECLADDVKPAIRGATEGRDALRGRTAEAIEERRFQLEKAAVDVEQSMEELARAVSSYADRLEEADKQLAEEL